MLTITGGGRVSTAATATILEFTTALGTEQLIGVRLVVARPPIRDYLDGLVFVLVYTLLFSLVHLAKFVRLSALQPAE